MGKLDDLKRMTASNVDDSLGVGRAPRPADSPTMATPPRWQGVTKSKNAVEIPLDKIAPDPDQPREEFDEESLARLATSLRTKGQLQPIRVRWDEGKGAYMILVGERRWRAAGMAGLPTIAAVVAEGPIDQGELLAIQLIENCLREDLKPIEQARAFRALMDRNGWSTRQLADELAVTQSAVVRALAMLDLPEAIQVQVDQGNLSPTTAYEITKVEDRGAMEELGRRAVEEKLTGAEVKELREKKQSRPRPRKVEHKDPNGCIVVISIPEGLEDDDALAALQRAVKAFRKSRPSRPEAA